MNNQMKIAYLISNIEEYGKFLSFLINNDFNVYRLYWDERAKGDRCYQIDWKEKRCYYDTRKHYEDNGYEIIKPDFVCNKYGDYDLLKNEMKTMREILFRGKRTTNGDWVEGNLCVPDSFNTVPQILMSTDTYRIRYDVIPSTVGQYTGLTDKNGKKIFEGDIIDTPDRLVKVVWFTGNAQFDLHFIRYKDKVAITIFKGIHMIDLKGYEVIGNIHDNPELLDG